MPQNAWTLSYLDVIGLCRLAYKASGTQLTTYEFGGRRWRIAEIYEIGSFRAITLFGRDQQNQEKKIVSFAGSDDRGDWGMGANLGNPVVGAENTAQYRHALEYGRRQNPDYFTGHSLGGGLALYCCVLMGIKTATINTSPLFNDIFGRQFDRDNATAQAINYCVAYELLAAGRNIAGVGAVRGTIGATPGRRVTVSSTMPRYRPISRHLLANLAGFIEPQAVSR